MFFVNIPLFMRLSHGKDRWREGKNLQRGLLTFLSLETKLFFHLK